MSSDANANASSSGAAAASPIQGGSSAPLSLEAILLQARSVAANRATPSAQGQQAVANAAGADADAAPASPLAAAASDSPTYASAADSKADAAAHNVGEKGTLKGGRASLMASAAPGTGASDQTPRPSAGAKRVPKNKSDDRNRSRTEMAVDNAIASDPNLSDDLSLHIVELKFFYQMSLVQVVAGLLTAVLSIYVASTGNSRAAGLIVTGLLATITAVFARTAGTSILGRELSEGQKAMLAKLQLNTYELLFAYMYSSVILAVLSLSFALGELSLNDNLLGVAGLFLFCVLCIGTMLAVRSLSLKIVLHYSFQFLNLLFLLFGYAIIFLAGWAYKKNILSRYTANANAWFAASIVVGVSTVLISFWGILASRRRSKRWLLSYAVVLSVLLAGVLAAAIGVYTNDSIVDDAVNQNCANILGDMADTSVQDELGCVKYAAVGDGAADTCPVGFATTVWETTAATQAADADTIRFGCINQQCCTAIKEYIHSNGRYLYLMALLGLVFGIAAVVAALYQRQMLRAGIKSDSMPNQEFYIMLAMTVLTVVCIVATPVAISTVSVPKLVPTTVDNNAALVVASEVTLSGCGRVTNNTLLYPTASISACVQASGGCYLSVTVESQAADVQFPPYADLHSIAVQPLTANGVVQRIQVSGLAAEINALFDGAGAYGLYFCPFCLVSPTSQAQFSLTLTYAGLNGAPAPAYGPWQDTVRITTSAAQSIVGVVKDGNTQVDTPLQGVGVRYEMYGQACEQIGAAVTTGADGRFSLPVPIPSRPGNGLAATVIFTPPNALYAEERTLVTIGGPNGGQAALVPAVVLYPAPQGQVNEQLCASNNGGCDVLTRCVPQSLTARYCTHCPTGYSGNADLQEAGATGCHDINECTAYPPNGNCDPLTVCTNLPGSYNCSDCSIGANGQPTGYYGNGKTGCIDVNECATNNGGFNSTFTCVNTPGSFQIGPCIFGYTTTYTNGVPTGCQNVNECEAGNGPCAPGVACTDFAPTSANGFKRFSCGPCPPGTSGDGQTCATLSPCDLNNGGCSQNPWVQCIFDGTSVTCGDGSANPCPHTQNPFNLAVDLGFTGDGKTCTDINECVVAPEICPLLYSADGCVNDFGFYICYDTSAGPAPAPQCETSDTGNGGCDVMTTCTAQEVGDPICGLCPSTPAPGAYPAVPLLDTIERPFKHTLGNNGAQAGVTSGKCEDVDECQYSPCDPLAVCTNKSPATRQSATTPGTFGTYDGFLCACGKGSNEYQGAGAILNPNLPHGYRAKQNGVQTSCTPIPLCSSTCDPHVSCTITNGQAICGGCPAGYVGSGSKAGGGCFAFNSCVVNNGGCSSLTTCNSTTNPNTCNPCPAGFSTTDGAKTCVDVNECVSGNGQCDPLTQCRNTAGSRVCSECPPGYSGTGDLTVDSHGCVDVNECASNNGGCDALSTCVNTPGGFTCGLCPAGYGGSGYSGCHMINQCAESAPCSPHTTCVMLAGPPATFECGACDPNCFRADSPRRNIGFNDGCVPKANCNDGNNGGCAPTALCVIDMQTNSSCPAIRCDVCPPGFTGTPPTCTDINECLNSPCSTHATCNNTVGSFTCTCDQYYGGNAYQTAPPGCQTFGCDATHNPCYQNAALSIAATCTDVPPAQCGPCPLLNGVKILVGDGITCTDYNECTDSSLTNGDCDPNGQCYNQNLSPRTCSPCAAPYQTGTGTRTDPCVDVNECATNNGGCATYSTCTNVVYDPVHNAGVGRTCGPCPTGYIGSGTTTCTPGDVCNPNPCGAFSLCTPNIVVGVSVVANCSCIADYERLPGATDCTPIQKCAAGYVRPGCNPATQVCSYCDPLSTCAQDPDSPIATCTTCGAGFTAGASGYMSAGGCAQFNINECQTGTDNCDPSVTCTDLTPSLANGRKQFSCSDCQPPAYEAGPGYGSCTDHNECTDPALTNGGCDAHATCQNTRGSRTCTCNTAQGWVGDGLTCVPDPTLCDFAHNPCDDLVTCSAGSPNPAPAVCGPCPAHYVGSGYLTLGGCSLADECGQPNNGDCTCGTTCTMHPTGRTCDFDGVQNACPPGFQGDGSFGGCTVINTCTPTLCGAGSCYMSQGDPCNHVAPAPYCVCPPGYEGNVTTGCIDIDECSVYAAINGGCSEHAQCVNTPGSFQCQGCNPGYCGNPYSRSADGCANINECAGQTCTGFNGPCVCSPHSLCTDLSPVNVNDPGYSCSACLPGWKSNRADNTGTGCNSCDNINECATNNGGCSLQPLRACTDKIPTNPGDPMYECDPCGSGWNDTIEISPSGAVLQVCVDINECLTPGVCDAQTTCTNSQGSYSCSACPCGMTSDSGDGKTPCRDVNECGLVPPHSLCPATNPFCFTSANVPNAVAVVSSVCVNGVRPADAFPFRCGPCPTGYGPIGAVDDGINCANINECATNNGGCAISESCVDTIGSRNCVCASGYEPAPGGGCQEINACLNGFCASGGDAPSTCVPTGPNTASCSCPAVGFSGTGYAGSPCTNINECATNHGGCDAHATCTDKIPANSGDPTHLCGACPTGYDGVGNVPGGCTPHNPCADPTPVNGGCDPLTVCSQTGPNTRACSDCPAPAAAPNTTQVLWYTKRVNGDGTETCVDINECATSNGGCWAGYNGAQGGVAAPAVTCTNYAPTPANHQPPYVCGACPSGWTGDPTNCQDVNECLTNNGDCTANSNCVNTMGSRNCVCIDGFNMTGGVCVNINECLVTPSVCSLAPAVTCTDLVPSAANNWQKYQCGACPAGYSGTGVTCDNVNECATNNGGCSTTGGSVCHDTIGNYTCGNCLESLGYYPKPGYTPCEPIQWCTQSNGGCDPVVTCTQNGVGPNPTAAGVVCGFCPQYYQPVRGNGQCPDVNECATNNGGCPTDPLVLCHNERGAPQWCDTCPPGFNDDTSSGSLTCVDINECLTTNGGCEQVCTNTPGSRRCSCNTGYTLNGDGVTCADVNECASANGGCSSLATCANTIGSRTCSCWAGTSGNGVDCANINECLYNNGNCTTKNSAPYATCADQTPTTPANGPFRTCTCPSGTAGTGVGDNGCVVTDVNECATNNGGCDQNAKCTRVGNSHTCACRSGYTGSGQAGTCMDVNECATNNGGCSRYCTPAVQCFNLAGSFYCGTCPSGYTGDGYTCVDVNECATNNGGCYDTCTNTVGSYSCNACPAGTTGNGKTCTDVNECRTNNGGCFAGAVCTNLVPTKANGYQTRSCSACPTGYSGAGVVFPPQTTAQSCADVNECAANNGGCYAGVRCTNTVGSRLCGACPDGYTGDGVNCVDINECKTNNGGCSVSCRPTVQCTNYPGGFSCGNCPTGYQGNPYVSNGCTDINECKLNNGGCGQYRACTNTDGSWDCGPCPAGTLASGSNCIDVNECATANGGCYSATGMKCFNTFGSFFCAYQPSGTCPNGNCPSTFSQQIVSCASGKCQACPPGFWGDGQSCTDINECATSNGGCPTASVCTNTAGSRDCACPTGYRLVGNACQNVNECATNNGGCDAATACYDNAGGRTCGNCPAGYVAGNGASPCVDINECATANGGCATNPLVRCTNTRGSRTCAACPSGYTGDGRSCTDINECACNNGGCRGTCTNTAGSYECSQCPSPWWWPSPDRFHCALVNECATNNGGCDPRAQCYDTGLSIIGLIIPYYCGPCPSGFTGSGYSSAGGCVDVNECRTNNGGCFSRGADKSTCTNTVGSRTCGACPAGYDGDGINCVQRNTASSITVKVVSATTGRPIPNAIIRMRANTLQGRCLPWDDNDSINGLAGRTYLDRDDYPHGSPAYTLTTNTNGVVTFNQIQSGGWSIESNGAQQPRLICLLGCSPFDWCHTRCLWCDAAPTGYSHGFKYINVDGRNAATYLLALSPTDLYLGQVRIVLSWDTTNNLNMHLTYATSSQQCDVSTVLAGTNCATTDIVREQRDSVDGTMGVETYKIAVPRTTTYQVSVQNASPAGAYPSIYDTGATVSLYIGWGWWGSSWPYVMLPVAGADPAGQDASRTKTYWAVYCAREYSWSGFAPLNSYSTALDWSYSRKGQTNTCPILRR